MDNRRIDEIINKYDGKPNSVIMVLMDIQHENKWLPREVLEKVSNKLGVPLSEVLHIATFYKTFSLKPQGVMRFTCVPAHHVISAVRQKSLKKFKI